MLGVRLSNSIELERSPRLPSCNWGCLLLRGERREREKGRKGWEGGREEGKGRGGRGGEGRLASHTIARPCVRD